jgi:hypothetical protein
LRVTLAKWHTITLSICDDEYKSNWPDFISDEEVRSLADDYASRGLLDVFYREFRNIPVAKESASFRAEHFRYYTEVDEPEGRESTDRMLFTSNLSIHPHVETVILVDPAKTVQMQSDFSAVVGVGVNLVTNKLFIRDVDARRMYPDELYDSIFLMAERLRARTLGIEVTSLNEFITFPLKNEMMRRGKFYELVELHARKSKLERVAALVPFYRRGEFYHNKACSGALEAQLLWFPKAKRIDIADALAYIVPMLEEGERYFQPTQKQMQDEFADLEYDPPLDFVVGVI